MDELRQSISEILVKWHMPTRQVAINEIMALIASYKTEVNRFEVIDHLNGGADGGRVLTRWEKQPFKVELSHQDDNRTLKVFLSDASSEPEGKPNE